MIKVGDKVVHATNENMFYFVRSINNDSYDVETEDGQFIYHNQPSYLFKEIEQEICDCEEEITTNDEIALLLKSQTYEERMEFAYGLSIYMSAIDVTEVTDVADALVDFAEDILYG